MTTNTPESNIQSAVVLRGTNGCEQGIYWRRESRKIRELEVPPKPTKTDELCAAVTEDHVLDVCLLFLTQNLKFTVYSISYHAALDKYWNNLIRK